MIRLPILKKEPRGINFDLHIRMNRKSHPIVKNFLQTVAKNAQRF